MSFMHEVIIIGERQGDYTEEYCTDTMKYFEFLFIHYIPDIEKLVLHLSHLYIIGNDHFAGKSHGMFVSRHEK